MSLYARRPLAARTHSFQAPALPSPMKTGRTASGLSKRPRSPEPAGESVAVKRVKAVPPSPAPVAARDADHHDDKEARRAKRAAQLEEFRIKYTKAFPSWVFYFEGDVEGHANKALLEDCISDLGGRVDDFFSNEVTHLITNRSVPGTDAAQGKENTLKPRDPSSRAIGTLKSPIKLHGRAIGTTSHNNDMIMKKALEFGMKVWSMSKLQSVVERCVNPPTESGHSVASVPTAVPTPLKPGSQRSLTRLLETERLYGTTSERDPTQKRHDFRYFSKNSYYVLVEDMHQELATIAALEYPIQKVDGKEKGAWPVLHCHPNSRGPFIEFDERERKRLEKTERAERVREGHVKEDDARRRAEERKRRTHAQSQVKRGCDLRRSVSMVNLQRRASHPDSSFHGLVDLEGDASTTLDSARASGYLASNANVAASGNSVGITSTTGTTSTAGHSLRSLPLPSVLREKLHNQVLTARRLPTPAADSSRESGRANGGVMGPPVGLPDRRIAHLRKSRSTNTLRLPKRDEGSKPGYCESCRQKFDDFPQHIQSRRHRKFAEDDTNFAHLDCVLARVQRRTLDEVETERREWEANRRSAGEDEDEDEDEYEGYDRGYDEGDEDEDVDLGEEMDAEDA